MISEVERKLTLFFLCLCLGLFLSAVSAAVLGDDDPSPEELLQDRCQAACVEYIQALPSSKREEIR